MTRCRLYGEQAVTLVPLALRTEAAQHPADVGLLDQHVGEILPLAGDECLGVARKRHAHGAREIAAGIQHAPGQHLVGRKIVDEVELEDRCFLAGDAAHQVHRKRRAVHRPGDATP